MEFTTIAVSLFAGGLLAGLVLGIWGERRRWERNGDPECYFRIESGGRLYKVLDADAYEVMRKRAYPEAWEEA